jgi:hypothetical protein
MAQRQRVVAQRQILDKQTKVLIKKAAKADDGTKYLVDHLNFMCKTSAHAPQMGGDDGASDVDNDDRIVNDNNSATASSQDQSATDDEDEDEVLERTRSARKSVFSQSSSGMSAMPPRPSLSPKKGGVLGAAMNLKKNPSSPKATAPVRPRSSTAVGVSGKR